MMKNGRPAGDALGMPGKQVDERLKKNYEFRRELYFVLRKSDWAVVLHLVICKMDHCTILQKRQFLAASAIGD